MKYRTIVAASIADTCEARQSHVDWADWLEEHPDEDSSQVGDVQHHREWVTKYDNVLSVLGHLGPRGTMSRRSGHEDRLPQANQSAEHAVSESSESLAKAALEYRDKSLELVHEQAARIAELEAENERLKGYCLEQLRRTVPF